MTYRAYRASFKGSLAKNDDGKQTSLKLLSPFGRGQYLGGRHLQTEAVSVLVLFSKSIFLATTILFRQF